MKLIVLHTLFFGGLLQYVIPAYNPLLTYTIRFSKMILHPNISGNYTIDSYREKTFINGNFKIDTTGQQLIDSVKVTFDRCNPEGFNCEYFQTWTLKGICQKLKDKTQIWSSWYNSYDPPMICPINKIYYKLKNATVDVGPVLKWYPDSANYQWRVKQMMYADEVYIGGFSLYLSIFGYRKRNKSTH